jgi:hypothetical protein
VPFLGGGHTPGHVFAALLAQALGPLAERHRHGTRLVDRAGLIGQPGEIGLEASPGRLHTLRRAGPPPPAITTTSSGSWPSGAGSSRRPTASRWASGARNTLLVAGGRSPSRASWFGSTVSTSCASAIGAVTPNSGSPANTIRPSGTAHTSPVKRSRRNASRAGSLTPRVSPSLARSSASK